MMEAIQFKAALARFPSPVTVVTACDGACPRGTTVSAFASLSLEPPLVSIALQAGSALADIIVEEGEFAVNLLGHRQEGVATRFASRCADRFRTVSWVRHDGLPRLIGAACYLACDLHQEVTGGDHRLLIGQVRSCLITDEPPLVYAARRFGTHSGLVPQREPTISDAIHACAA